MWSILCKINAGIKILARSNFVSVSVNEKIDIIVFSNFWQDWIFASVNFVCVNVIVCVSVILVVSKFSMIELFSQDWILFF